MKFMPKIMQCPNASSSSKGVKRPFAAVIEETGEDSSSKMSIFEVIEEIRKEEEENESQMP